MDFRILEDLLGREEKKNSDIDYGSIDYSWLLGYLNINRVSSIAFQNILKKNIVQLKKNNEFMRNLQSAYQFGCIKNEYMKKDINFISEILNFKKIPYVFLKGAFLSLVVYKKGLRTSNDIDILIERKELENVEETLKEKGFVQGHIGYDGKLKLSSRLEIIRARMSYGEVMPYTYVFGDHSVRLDINLSLDYKPEDNPLIISEMIKNRNCFSIDGNKKYFVLDKINFLLHLCCHLYKEATTFNWVESNRDLSLYKFVDIFQYINYYHDNIDKMQLLNSINKYNLIKECYYTLKNTVKIFPTLLKVKWLEEVISELEPDDTTFMNQVICPAEKAVYQYTISFEQRILKSNKLLYLRKVE